MKLLFHTTGKQNPSGLVDVRCLLAPKQAVGVNIVMSGSG